MVVVKIAIIAGLAMPLSFGTAFAGAIIITIGMFFPCFVFTIAGHHLLEKLVHNKVMYTQLSTCLCVHAGIDA